MEDDFISMSQAVHADANPSVPFAAPPTVMAPAAPLYTSDTLGFQCSPPDLRSHVPGKDINDPIHSGLHLPSNVMRFVDTPYFQRLRYLKQLGCTYFVYPGAQHTRLEHSLGVAYMAFQWASRVQNNFSNEADVEPRDVHLLMLAGALHDVGHGPFSHMFEELLHGMDGMTDWKHEQMSSVLVDAIVDDFHIDMDREDVRRVQQLITVKKDPGPAEHKKWMFEIVNNWRNGLDVDKFDYLLRDSHYCNIPFPCQMTRLQNNFKVIGDEIVFKYTVYHDLQKVFTHRADMHRQVYKHRKVKAVEFMVCDALRAADRSLHFTDHIHDPKRYVQLDDGLLRTIRNFDLLVPDAANRAEYAGLREAQGVLDRLEKRKLYRFVTEVLVPAEDVARGVWKVPTPQDIACVCSPGGVTINPDDIILSEAKIDFAMKNRNPLNSVHFFADHTSNDKYPLSDRDMTTMNLNHYQEVLLRIYTRNTDPQHVAAVYEAMGRWQEKRFGDRSKGLRTPLKARRQLGDDGPPLIMSQQGGSSLTTGPDIQHIKNKRQRTLFACSQDSVEV